MHETGDYTMSMYSKFNSNIPSPVYGFSLKDGGKVWPFKERETLQECLSFWGSKHPTFIKRKIIDKNDCNSFVRNGRI